MRLIQKTTTLIAILSLVFITSCINKEGVVETLSNSDAKELIENAIGKTNAGLTVDIEDLSTKTIEDFSVNLECNTPKQGIFQRSYTGVNKSVNYTVNWSYEMRCNGLHIPTSLSLSSTSNGSYTTLHITSTDAITTTIEVLGLQPTQDNLNFSGVFKRNGNQEINGTTTKNISSNLEVIFSDLLINKTSKQLLSGTATIFLTGTITDGEPFSMTGGINFLGNKQATLTLNGETFQLDLS